MTSSDPLITRKIFSIISKKSLTLTKFVKQLLYIYLRIKYKQNKFMNESTLDKRLY